MVMLTLGRLRSYFNDLPRRIRKHADTASPAGVPKRDTQTLLAVSDPKLQIEVDTVIEQAVRLSKDRRLSPARKMRSLLELDEGARSLADRLWANYLASGDDPDQTRRRHLLPTILSYTEEMADAYKATLRDYGSQMFGQSGAMLALLVARAMRYYAMQVKWSYVRYVAPGAYVWRMLNSLLLAADQAGIARKPLRLYPADADGDGAVDTSCEAEFVKAHLLHLSRPSTLREEDIQLLDRWLSRHAGTVAVERDFVPGRHLYVVDLSQGKPAKRISQPAHGAQYRVWGVGLLVAAMVESTDRDGTFAQPRAGPVMSRALVDTVAGRWMGHGIERMHEREPCGEDGVVAMGFEEICALLRTRGEEKSGRTWHIADRSVTGVGAQFDVLRAEKPSPGALILVQPVEGECEGIGVVRRIGKPEGAQVHVGIERLGEDPRLAWIYPEDDGVPSGAVWLFGIGEDAGESRLILAPGCYRRGQPLRVEVDGVSRSVRLGRVLAAGPDFVVTGLQEDNAH